METRNQRSKSVKHVLPCSFTQSSPSRHPNRGNKPARPGNARTFLPLAPAPQSCRLGPARYHGRGVNQVPFDGRTSLLLFWRRARTHRTCSATPEPQSLPNKTAKSNMQEQNTRTGKRGKNAALSPGFRHSHRTPKDSTGPCICICTTPPTLTHSGTESG